MCASRTCVLGIMALGLTLFSSVLPRAGTQTLTRPERIARLDALNAEKMFSRGQIPGQLLVQFYPSGIVHGTETPRGGYGGWQSYRNPPAATGGGRYTVNTCPPPLSSDSEAI